MVQASDRLQRGRSWRISVRKEKCALDRGAIEALILNNTYGTLALSQEGKPYSIPMNYGYRDGCFYFHGAQEGMRYEYVQANSNACFCIVDHETLRPELFSTDYASVIAHGKIELVEKEDEKKNGLMALLERCAPKRLVEGSTYIDRAVLNTAVYKFTVEKIEGKQRKRL